MIDPSLHESSKVNLGFRLTTMVPWGRVYALFLFAVGIAGLYTDLKNIYFAFVCLFMLYLVLEITHKLWMLFFIIPALGYVILNLSSFRNYIDTHEEGILITFILFVFCILFYIGRKK